MSPPRTRLLTRHKSFTMGVGCPDTIEPVTFDLSGGPPLSPVPWTETFTCVAVAPAGILESLVSSVEIDDGGGQVYSAPALMAFMRGVLIDGDRVRFDEVVSDPHRVVELDDLGRLVRWLSPELVRHPTKPSPVSSAGLAPTGRGSTAPSPSPASIEAVSERNAS